jgi:hypothetical protein
MWLINAAHTKGLSIGSKNAGEMIKDIVNDVEFGIVESAFHYKETNDYTQLITAGKPVFACEYTETGENLNSFCAKAKQLKFAAILKHVDLEAWVQFCPA